MPPADDATPPDPADVPRTHPERVLFPDDGITKGEVVDYYEAVAPRMVPLVAGRPLSLQRFRKGIDAGGFFQQNRAKHFPAWVGAVEIERAEGDHGVQTVCDNAAALVYLANQGSLTFHAWPARVPRLECPDRLVLDLDPPEDDFGPVRRAALVLREVLAEFGLEAVPLLTGSRGAHVIVPLDATTSWDDVWPRTKAIGAALVKRAPKEFTRAFYKSQRRGRLYVDTVGARRGHTSIAPWTVRARPGAPVAVPVTWDELEHDDALHARRWTIRDALDRPADPWEGAHERGQDLAAAVPVADDA